MSAHARSEWFWNDWLGDQAVRRLTLAERGLWIDLIAFAAVASPRGYVCDDHGRPLTHEEIARVSNAGSPVEVAELISNILSKGAASRDRSGRLFNRRMVREAELRAKRSLAGKKGAAHTNYKYFKLHGNDHLPRQTTRQVTQQKIRAPPLPLSKANKNPALPTSGDTARARSTHNGNTSNQPAKTAEPKSKQPSKITKAELDALFEARRIREKPT